MTPFITCEITFVSMSASCFLVSMYLILILESKLTLSNNRYLASLWDLDSCLIAGLLPFMIILITASFSSNTSTPRLVFLVELVLWISLRTRLLGT